MNNSAKYLIACILLTIAYKYANAQYSDCVEVRHIRTDRILAGVLNLSRKGNHVKVKQFAAYNHTGKTLRERYREWAVGKKVICYTSSTYMNNCASPGIVTPIGLYVDEGKIVNYDITKDELDALVILYSTGSMVVSTLTKKNVVLPRVRNIRESIDLRNNSYHRALFLKWAVENDISVFQTHLYVYEDSLIIHTNSSPTLSARRLLAICRTSEDDVIHYILNFPNAITEYNAVLTTSKFLKKMEEMMEIVIVIYLEAGCQTIFTVFNENGNKNNNHYYKGTESLTSVATNLPVYYFE